MSNADSEEFGRFLDDRASEPGERPRDTDLGRAGSTRSRAGPRRAHTRPRRIVLEPRVQDAPLRIHTRRPIDLRLRPPPELSEAGSDAHGGRDGPAIRQQADSRAGSQAAGFRIFSRSEVRDISIARPPSSPSEASLPPRPNATMQWRLRGLLGDSVSTTSFQPRDDAESDRFTLGSVATARTSRPMADGTTTGIRRALDSRFVERAIKRTRPNENILAHLDSNSSEKQNVELGALNGDLSSQQPVWDQSDLLSHEPDRASADGSAHGLDRASERSMGQRDDETPGSGLFVNDPPSSLSSEEARAQNDRIREHRHASGQEPVHEPVPEDEDRPRPREPLEPEAPLVFEVPVSEIPNIDWGANDLDVDGTYLQQQLEHSESESEEDSDTGSVAEMIDDSSEDEQLMADPEKGLAEWTAPADVDENASSDDSDSDGDSSRVEALTDSGSDNEQDYVDPNLDLAAVTSVAQARKERPKRARIPTVNWWLGECIEYETDAKNQLMTAIDVRRVEPPHKVYRKRRSYRRRITRSQQPLSMDDMEAEAGQEAIQAPVFDTAKREWTDRTVAKSISGLEFVPVEAEDGSRLPLVSQCVLFGGRHDSSPLRLLVLRIEPGGMFSYSAEQNKASTFVVWRGKCTVHLNTHEFDISKGMACLVPRGNDLFVDNGSSEALSTGDVYLFVTEVNAEVNPQLADALTRDAQSMISGAAAFSNMFDSERASDQAEEGGQPQEETHDELPPSVNDFDGGGGFAEPSDMPDELHLEQQSNGSGSFGHSLSRALGRSEGRAEPVREAVPERNPAFKRLRSPPESLSSLSRALGGDSAIPSRFTPRDEMHKPPAVPSEGEDSLEMFSDYLEGRKGRKRLVLHDRPVGDMAQYRIERYLRSAREDSNYSR